MHRTVQGGYFRINGLMKLESGQHFDYQTTHLHELLDSLGATSRTKESLVEIEMPCKFTNPLDVCRDGYNNFLRHRQSYLLTLYFQVKEFEALLDDKLSGKGFGHLRTRKQIQEAIEENLEAIGDFRQARSCPGFKNEDFLGGNCQNQSKYIHL